MSSESSSGFSTDAIRHLYRWDEIEGYQLLADHFELVEGFSFIVVFAPDDWAIALLREQLPELLRQDGTIERVCFDPDQGTDSLAESLLEFAEPADNLQLVWIDTDPAPPDQLEQRADDWHAALARLNRYRNTLQDRFSCTLALALPSRLQKTLREAAPDIWSIRAGVFRIDPPGGSRGAIEQLPARERETLSRLESSDSGDPAETLAEIDKLRGKPGREVLLIRLLQRAGNQARERLDWKTSQRCFDEAWSLLDRIGRGDPELEWDLATDIANVFIDIARYNRAEHYLRSALQVAEQHFGEDDSKTATTLNNLAILLQSTNRLSKAEPLMRRALTISEQSDGPEHPAFAIRLNNLARLLQDTNRLSEAEPLMRRALTIDEQSYGPEHPEVATDLGNLARLLQDTNRLSEAEPLMRRALAIDEQSYGPEHPHVARDLNNLAQLLRATNRLSEAEPLMRRALAIRKTSLGEDHPNYGTSLNDLGNLLRDTNRMAEAEPLLRQVVTIYEQTLGPEHPWLGTALNNLALLLQDTNRLSEAAPLMRRALTIDEQSYGPEHPNVARDLNNLARLLHDTNRLSEAEPLMRRALEICESSLGSDHPNTRTVKGNLDAMREAGSRD